MLVAHHNMPHSHLWNKTTNIVFQKCRVRVSITSGKGVEIKMCMYNNFNYIIMIIMGTFLHRSILLFCNN